MSWIISNALMVDYANWRCSQVLEGESLEDTCLDGEQSVQSSGIPTQPVYLSPDKMTAFSRLSRFGMMCKPLTADRGEDLLTWYLEAFHVRTYPVQEKAQASQVSGQECGRTWRGSLAKYDPVTHLLKTAQCSLLEGSIPSSVTLPRWGTMRNGELYQQPTVELHTDVNESGLWRTPTAHDWKNTGNCSQLYLSDQVRPHQIKNPKKPAIAMVPTPNARDWKEQTLSPAIGALADRPEKSRQLTRYMSKNMPELHGGKLNPTWVEWLMGWPLGWTDLQPLAMDKFQEWRQQHLKY